MSVFIDTSAFFALLDHRDTHSAAARRSYAALSATNEKLVTSNYVVVETTALLQKRLGLEAVRDLHATLLPLADVTWITPTMHRAATMALFASGRRKLSLVDCCSFELMRELGIGAAFAFDHHFVDEGFDLV
jgi:predicted nucleic acid-binding protein